MSALKINIQINMYVRIVSMEFRADITLMCSDKKDSGSDGLSKTSLTLFDVFTLLLAHKKFFLEKLCKERLS